LHNSVVAKGHFSPQIFLKTNTKGNQALGVELPKESIGEKMASIGNFHFLKKPVDGPDYYGNSRHAPSMDWETFSNMLDQVFAEIGNCAIQFNMENQILWNFKLEIEPLPNGELKLHSTGYHTHGGKKGKQLDANLIENLKAMGLTQPAGEERNWTIVLTQEESNPAHVNRVIIHLLERGYEFNPNLIQELTFAAYGDEI
jgi:hypothetical protein